MSARLGELAMRRQRLIARAAGQRAALAAMTSAVAPTGRLADRALLLANLLKAHPAWAAGALAAGGFLLSRRRRAALWLGRAWMVWRAWQTLQGWLRRPAA
jgi:hypothetical protein